MIIRVGLWALVAICEWLVYVGIGANRFQSKSLRWAVGVLLLVGQSISTFYLLESNWHIWLLPSLIMPYRFINVARFMKYRLQQNRLSSVSLRAHAWLLVVQVGLTCLALIFHVLPLTHAAGIIVGVQFLVTMVLLRSTTQTWEFAKSAPGGRHYTDKELPTVSVLIPARDETEALQVCLDSLIRNDYPKLEILVLDDCSQDKRTPEIIRGYAHDGIRFIKGDMPDEHWVAKNHACEQLRKEANGEMLMFCSADVAFEPTSIRRMVESMLNGNKEMLSLLPSRSLDAKRNLSFLEPMRYYWELCLPRRLFKRPPVLSTCWLIKAETLEHFGGFDSVRQSVAAETHFARRAVISGGYSFLRSGDGMSLYNTKQPSTQFDTTVRVRYPQLHRRLDLVAATSLFELFFLAGPFVGLLCSPLLPNNLAYILGWLAVVAASEVIYYYVSVETRLNSTFMAMLTAPLAILVDIYMLHVSLLRYEFGTVSWKGRNVCIPVMRVEAKLPRLTE